MIEPFRRTLETAADAEGVAALLLRAAADVPRPSVRARLRHLAGRYAEYGAALRETVNDVPAEQPAEQLSLIRGGL